MGDRSAEMLNIMIAIIAIVALMALGFAIFTIAKRMANNSQNDLVNQLDSISSSLFTDLDQVVITGARLKGVVSQAATTDCAIVVSTLGWLGAQTSLGNGSVLGEVKDSNGGNVTAAEASLNGNVSLSMQDAKVPVVQLEDMGLYTALGTSIEYPLAVNFGSILKNSVQEPASGATPWGKAGDEYKSTLSYNSTTKKFTVSTIEKYNASPEYAQTIRYKDGEFGTKLEFATNLVNSKILRYDMTSDFTKVGKTFSIPDTAQFNSYVLKNASGEYLGLVFLQMRK